ncbi:MAG: hypothetical protein V4474_00405 [Patescibacteria group bacterium]
MEAALIDEIRHALTAKPNGEQCPYTEDAPRDIPTYIVPPELRNLLIVLHRREERVNALSNSTHENDGGYTFHHQRLSDVPETLLSDTLCSKHEGQPYAMYKMVYYWAEWKYSFTCPR